mmetsp:Transcript_20377/g.50118  ORF Transcript_20377/g.50118 Transcript_20377/m.50118 type:complete len:223 (+) Transcript_20377:104-772(+)
MRAAAPRQHECGCANVRCLCGPSCIVSHRTARGVRWHGAIASHDPHQLQHQHRPSLCRASVEPSRRSFVAGVPGVALMHSRLARAAKSGCGRCGDGPRDTPRDAQPQPGLTMLRLVSAIPACVAPPWLPMPSFDGSDDATALDLTISLLVSNMPACDAWPVLPLPRKVCAEAPARICSSENSRTFASAIFAPNVGPLYPGTFCAMRPSDCRLVRTCIMSLFS